MSGGATAHLLDSAKKYDIQHVANYHEQASAMATEGYGRINPNPSLVLVTNGPGSSNTITGVVGAFQDSIPMFVLSGQVPTNQTVHTQTGLRQLGVQEVDIIKLVKENFKIPVMAYQVSGEYSLLSNGIRNNLIDKTVILESLISLKRAGATAIISYYADRIDKIG